MRLDFVVSSKLGISRTKAQNLIKEDKVMVGKNVVNKPAFEVEDDKNITILQADNFVSRGAYKLVGAIEKFDFSLQDKVVLDMGASTGGFTQVSLLNGAKKVYSVDVGHGELDKSLSQNEKVVNMEGRDIRTLTKAELKDVEIVVGDLSFISLKYILPKINELFGKIECVLLFKPQFECGKDVAKKYRGVIKDKAVHKQLLREFSEEIKLYNYTLSNLTYSSIKGKEGNIEYLVHLNGKGEKYDICQVVESAFLSLK